MNITPPFSNIHNSIGRSGSARRRSIGVIAVLAMVGAACSGSDRASEVPPASTAPGVTTQATDTQPASSTDAPAPSSTVPTAPTEVTETTAGPVASVCDGPFIGTYAGDDAGGVEIDLVNGQATISFASSNVDRTIDGIATVSSDGAIDAALNTGASATGTLDSTSCTMAGSWTNGGLVGTWSARRTDSAAPIEPAPTTPPSSAVPADTQAPVDSAAGCTDGSTFRGLQLIQEDFTGDLSCADFSLSVHSQTTFVGATLDGASFGSAQLGQTTFTDSSMRDVDLRGATLAQVTFTRVDLTGARTGGTIDADSVFVDVTCPDGSSSVSNGDICDLSQSEAE